MKLIFLINKIKILCEILFYNFLKEIENYGVKDILNKVNLVKSLMNDIKFEYNLSIYVKKNRNHAGGHCNIR